MIRYPWVLFDADGTLFDYDRAEAAALEETFVEQGVPFAPAHLARYREINARLWRDYEQGQVTQEALKWLRFARLLEGVGIEADPHLLAARYLEHLSAQRQLVPDALETVRALHGRAGLALITNGLHQVQRPRLAGSPLAPFFDVVVISEEVGAAKPDAAIFDIALAAMGHPRRDEVLIVGDSLSSDIRGGSDYGIDTCWFNPARLPRPDGLRITYEIAALDELPAIVIPEA